MSIVTLSPPLTDDRLLVLTRSSPDVVRKQPTVLFDGLVEGSISSSWGKEEWDKFVQEKVVA